MYSGRKSTCGNRIHDLDVQSTLLERGQACIGWESEAKKGKINLQSSTRSLQRAEMPTKVTICRVLIRRKAAGLATASTELSGT